MGQEPRVRRFYLRQSQYLILNLAVSGDWGGEVDDSIFPQKYCISYVRVYEKSGR
jgi:hypothetical protein